MVYAIPGRHLPVLNFASRLPKPWTNRFAPVNGKQPGSSLTPFLNTPTTPNPTQHPHPMPQNVSKNSNLIWNAGRLVHQPFGTVLLGTPG